MNSRSISFTAVAVLVLLVASAVADLNGGGFESVDSGRLAALANDLRADVAKSALDGSIVKVRVQTKDVADPNAAGCGFAFLVNDEVSLSSHVPQFEQAACSAGGDSPRVDQRVQFVRPNATYEGAVTLKSSLNNVTFTSNGGNGLEIDTLCLGFKNGDGDAQAFCLDRQLLGACFSSCPVNKVVLGPVDGGIRLSRAFMDSTGPRSKEIVFRNLKGIARGFDLLVRDPSDIAVEALVCTRISLSKEKSPWAYDTSKCYTERKDVTGEFYYMKMDAHYLSDKCTRATK